MRVRVYKNLHKNCYSVKAHDGPMKGRVVAYKNEIVLEDVVFKVGEKARQRVLREGVKNVHAYVEGTIDPSALESKSSYIDGLEVSDDLREIRYNPYECGSFVTSDELQPIDAANMCVLCDTGVFVRGD